jgi:hypothetical protein
MIYFSKVSSFFIIAKLNILTWAFGLTLSFKLKYLIATLFGLIEWPSLRLGICEITIDGY